MLYVPIMNIARLVTLVVIVVVVLDHALPLG